MFLSRVRSIARPLTRRGSWETLSRAMPVSKQDDFNAAVAAFNKRKEKAAAIAPAGPIDFDQYVDVLGADEVAAIRKEYESFKYTDFEEAKAQELASVRAQLAKVVAAIETDASSMLAAAGKASEEVSHLQVNRTSMETTINDVHHAHPELFEEGYELLANDNFDTAFKPLDVSALRLKAIEENWDEAALGKLDDDTQKQFLEEIAALDAASAQTTDAAGYELSEYLSKYISEWHAILGRPEDAAAIKASVKASVEANRVTAADLAIKNERQLWAAIDLAGELGMHNRVNGLLAHAKALRDSGEIEVDLKWREEQLKKLTAARRHRDYNTPPDAAELEGKSAAELEALADAAANDADFFRASHLLYAARVASGDIDTKSTDLDSFSGFSNHFYRSSQGVVRSTA